MVFVIIVLFFLNVYILLPMLIRPFLSKRLSAILKRSGYTCLTFDDGPDLEMTPEILNILRKAGAKATFFVLGEKVDQYPGIVARIVDEGHELGEHSYRHLHPWKCDPLRSAMDLLKGRRSVLKYRSSIETVPFRPPYGKLNLITILHIFFMRSRPVFWDIDPRDYDENSAEKVAREVLNKLRPGSVVLLHDGRRDPYKNSQVTASALGLILKASKETGLRFSTISEATRFAGVQLGRYSLTKR
ncbi:MAG: polysaccharide deacetylase family protein [Candidatus Hodarchaeota archaeon]